MQAFGNVSHFNRGMRDVRLKSKKHRKGGALGRYTVDNCEEILLQEIR